MAASLHEQIVARVKAVLLTSSTAAGARVHRGRKDGFSDDELPALNVMRRDGDIGAHARGVNNMLVQFSVECLVDATPVPPGTGDDWETAADALHMQVHVALEGDSQLALLGGGLRCTATQMEGDHADRMVGRLTAQYQMQVLVRENKLEKKL